MQITKKPDHEIFKKPNAALVMVPRIGSLSPISRKMYNVLLHKTQNQIREIEEAGRVVPAEHLFSSSLADIVSSFAIEESDPRTLAKKYLKEMQSTKVDWEAPDAKTGVVWRGMHLLSEAALEIRNGQTWVEWAFPPSIFKAVKDPSNQYTLLNLSNISKLKGYIALALYEICSRYKNNHNGLTSSNSTDWWVDALTASPASIDPATGKKRPRRAWRKIKSAGVIQAIAEINEKTDINIVDLIEIKSGKAVVEVQFVVEKKKVEIENKESTKVSSIIALAASKTQISLDALVKLSQSGCTDEEIEYGLGKLDVRKKRADLAPLENEPAYFRAVVNDAQGKIVSTQNSARTQNGIGSVEIDRQANSTVKPSPADQLKTEKRLEFLALNKEDKKIYFEKGFAAMKVAGFATPSIIRKFEQGDWDNKAILTYAVDAFAMRCTDIKR